MMARVRFTAFSNLQTVDAAGAIVSYRGETGEVRDVPEDIAVVLVEQGFAETFSGESVPRERAVDRPAPRKRKK